MTVQHIKRKLAAILSADVEGNKDLIEGEDISINLK